MSWPFVVVDRTPHPCPYLPGRQAVLPMRLPLLPLPGAAFDACLDHGDRRQGILVYRPDCGACTACEPIRVDVGHFAPNATQRRVRRAGLARLEVSVGPPVVDADHVRLYNLHKRLRHLDDDPPASIVDYAAFLGESCTDTVELSYRRDGVLVGAAIVDRGAQAASAVYCCYDPRVPGVSIGVFSVLETIAWCQRWGKRWLYLGYYVAGCRAMRYKAHYGPHERLIDGQWRPFARAPVVANVPRGPA